VYPFRHFPFVSSAQAGSDEEGWLCCRMNSRAPGGRYPSALRRARAARRLVRGPGGPAAWSLCPAAEAIPLWRPRLVRRRTWPWSPQSIL